MELNKPPKPPFNRKAGSFISEPAVLVRHKARGASIAGAGSITGGGGGGCQSNGVASGSSQIWSIEKLESKLIDMREVYEEVW